MKPLNLKRPTLLIFIYFLLPQVIFTSTCPLATTIADTTCTIDPAQMKAASELSRKLFKYSLNKLSPSAYWNPPHVFQLKYFNR